MFDLLPITPGWKYSVLRSQQPQTYNRNMITLIDVEGFGGWLLYLKLITNDTNINVKVYLDDVPYITYMPNDYLGSTQMVSGPANITIYNLIPPGTNQELYGLVMYSNEGLPYTCRLKVSLETLTPPLYVQDYEIKLVEITDPVAFKLGVSKIMKGEIK